MLRACISRKSRRDIHREPSSMYMCIEQRLRLATDKRLWCSGRPPPYFYIEPRGRACYFPSFQPSELRCRFPLMSVHAWEYTVLSAYAKKTRWGQLRSQPELCKYQASWEVVMHTRTRVHFEYTGSRNCRILGLALGKLPNNHIILLLLLNVNVLRLSCTKLASADNSSFVVYTISPVIFE